jgi:hypothetical protein
MARRAIDHVCTMLKTPVGVDDCAEGQYCVDSSTSPNQCIDVSAADSCMVGVEIGTAACLPASSPGTQGMGVSYCKADYCI